MHFVATRLQKQSAKATTMEDNNKKKQQQHACLLGEFGIFMAKLASSRKWQTNDASARRRGHRTQGQHVANAGDAAQGQIVGRVGGSSLADSWQSAVRLSSKSCFHFSDKRFASQRLGQFQEGQCDAGQIKRKNSKENVHLRLVVVVVAVVAVVVLAGHLTAASNYIRNERVGNNGGHTCAQCPERCQLRSKSK